MYLYAALDDIGELLLANEESNFEVELLIGVGSVNVAEVLGPLRCQQFGFLPAVHGYGCPS